MGAVVKNEKVEVAIILRTGYQRHEALEDMENMRDR